MAKFEKSRFHKAFGPKSLFDRVIFKMSQESSLKLNGKHFNKRLIERKIPKIVLDEVKNFNTQDWEVVTVEVRTDKGKFVNSTWEKEIGGARYWITIGFGNLVQTVIKKDSSGIHNIIKSGELYRFVEQVNLDLMKNE